MRKVSEAEAAALLAAQAGGAAAPAALAETDAMPARSLQQLRHGDRERRLRHARAVRGRGLDSQSPEPRKWLGDQTEVVIGLGHGEVQVGDQFDIFRTEARVTDLDTGCTTAGQRSSSAGSRSCAWTKRARAP
jgi:hypothetical protein